MVEGRPTDAQVLAAARHVLGEVGAVVSLARFLRMVRERLAALKESQVLGGVRLRHLMVVAPYCRLDIRTRRGSKTRILNRCPVCTARLEKVQNQTLFGGEVTLTLRCPRCPYRTGKEKRVPTLYTFHLQTVS
jgi:hypothetical protein